MDLPQNSNGMIFRKFSRFFTIKLLDKSTIVSILVAAIYNPINGAPGNTLEWDSPWRSRGKDEDSPVALYNLFLSTILS